MGSGVAVSCRSNMLAGVCEGYLVMVETLWADVESERSAGLSPKLKC